MSSLKKVLISATPCFAT